MVGSEVMRFAPPPLEADEDELEHYKTQVKIMTDLINVSHWERERERRGRERGKKGRERGEREEGERWGVKAVVYWSMWGHREFGGEREGFVFAGCTGGDELQLDSEDGAEETGGTESEVWGPDGGGAAGRQTNV